MNMAYVFAGIAVVSIAGLVVLLLPWDLWFRKAPPPRADDDHSEWGP